MLRRRCNLMYFGLRMMVGGLLTVVGFLTILGLFGMQAALATLVALAVLMVALDYFEPLSSRRRDRVLQTGERCEAAVIRVERMTKDQDDGLIARAEYKIVVKFVDLSGQTQRVDGEIGRRWSYSQRGLRIDSPVQIAYDKAKPSDLVYLDVAPVKGFHRLTDMTLSLAILAILPAGLFLKEALG